MESEWTRVDVKLERLRQTFSKSPSTIFTSEINLIKVKIFSSNSKKILSMVLLTKIDDFEFDKIL